MIDARHLNASQIFSFLESKDIPFGHLQQSYLAAGSIIVSGRLDRMEIVTIPFICRITALLLLLPFALCIGLDIIAYAIARTLRLSILQARVPGSPSEISSAISPSPASLTDGYAFASPAASQNRDGQDGIQDSPAPASDLSNHRSVLLHSVREALPPPPVHITNEESPVMRKNDRRADDA